jgi:aminobenzoyl-glutamate utilization protein B
VQARIATHAIGTPGHSWQITAQGVVPAAHKGMVHAAKVMAGTAMEALRSPELIAAAKADHAKRTGGKPYQCPIPDDVQPLIPTQPAA